MAPYITPPKKSEQHGIDEGIETVGVRQRRVRKRKKSKGKATEDARTSKYSGESHAHTTMEEDSGKESEMEDQESNDTASERQMLRTFKAKTLRKGPHKGQSSRSGQRPLVPEGKGSWGMEIANDILKCLNRSFKIVRISYPLWKWIAIGYLLWMGFSFLLAWMYRSAASILSPVCSHRIIQSNFPPCSWIPGAESHAIDVSKVVTSQEGLTMVMDRVGENFDLAREMTGHEFAVRDLRIRVAASNLSRRQELAQELDSLSRYTKKTAKDLSRFTAKVSKSIDAVHTFDDYAIRTLETIAESQKSPPTLLGQVLLGLSPFAAFTPSGLDQSEERVKHLFIHTADSISNKVQVLIEESFELGHNLDAIQETLDRIKELTIDEIGDLPRANILNALWIHLARPDDHEQQKSHTNLLADMGEFYKRSSFVVEETVAALNRIEAEMGEFRDDYATPGLILKDHPLEVIVELLRKSGQRLEAGKQQLEFIEGGARVQRDENTRTSTRIVHASTA